MVESEGLASEGSVNGCGRKSGSPKDGEPVGGNGNGSELSFRKSLPDASVLPASHQ